MTTPFYDREVNTYYFFIKIRLHEIAFAQFKKVMEMRMYVENRNPKTQVFGATKMPIFADTNIYFVSVF